MRAICYGTRYPSTMLCAFEVMKKLRRSLQSLWQKAATYLIIKSHKIYLLLMLKACNKSWWNVLCTSLAVIYHADYLINILLFTRSNNFYHSNYRKTYSKYVFIVKYGSFLITVMKLWMEVGFKETWVINFRELKF